MRHLPIDSALFIENRARLRSLLPSHSISILHANDVLPTNADGSIRLIPNSDLFYLSGIEQEETVLVICPDAVEETHQEILFIREPIAHLETWEGHKLTKEEATAISGIKNIKWVHELPNLLPTLMIDSQEVFLNQNEHRRAVRTVQTRDDRFVLECKEQFPLHTYRRLAPLLHRLRVVKSEREIELLKQAIKITDQGFRRILKATRPGVTEHFLEAEFAHEFISNRASFAYTPIIASGKGACSLHYISNDQECRDGDLLLLDVGANYANYNADLTRTIPINGKFTPRQRSVYDAVLRVMRACIQSAVVGTYHRDWQIQAQAMMNDELLQLGLISNEDIANQKPKEFASRKYFMHGLGHPLGLDVHDVGPSNVPFAEGWVLTVEPGIYIPEEGFGVRLENDILITENGPVDLMAEIPVEADEIESLMAAAK
ncbi:aminopeptidase P family protein [Planctomicrobium sp. SH668]|uniref:aminopeptidase P family protein n=1 Tax=Planctomicrobium sp. SH668 TaxID=3448126 RepID=UPI003F5C1D1D